MDAELEYYGTPGPTTELGRYDQFVTDLPDDAVRLGEIVRGVLVHNSVVAMRGMTLPP